MLVVEQGGREEEMYKWHECSDKILMPSKEVLEVLYY